MVLQAFISHPCSSAATWKCPRTPCGTKARLTQGDAQLIRVAPGTLLSMALSYSSPVCPPPKAIMQTTARKHEWPLDKMCLTVDVTKKTKEDYGHPPREGAYLHGLLMEGTMSQSACRVITVRTFLTQLQVAICPLLIPFLSTHSHWWLFTSFPAFKQFKC